MHVTGRCHCGAISIEAEIAADDVFLCHCADCQVFSGSAFRAVAPARRESLIVTGEPRTYVKIAESGARRAQMFCGDCGAALYAGDADGVSPLISLRVGFLDQRAEITPRRQIWRRSALVWADHLASIPGVERGG
jgi:hypothetical protein